MGAAPLRSTTPRALPLHDSLERQTSPLSLAASTALSHAAAAAASPQRLQTGWDYRGEPTPEKVRV